MKTLLRLLPLLAVLWFGAAGCASNSSGTPRPDPMYDAAPPGGWSLSELENTIAGGDPLEPFNRCMFAVNEVIMEYFVEYIGCVYCSILPRPLIDMINNACLNLEYPARAISCLLSAEWRGAGDETIRFFANSTLGIGGLFDVAKAWWKIYSTESDFGQSFADWGIDPGCTLILPCCPRINVRDTVGLIFDSAFDGKTYIPYAGSATAMNRFVIAHRGYKQLVDGASDKYKNYRQLMALYRQLLIRKHFYRTRTEAAAKPPEIPPPSREAPEAPAALRGHWFGIANYHGVSPINDSMRLLFFAPRQNDDFWWHRLSLWNRDFISQGSRRRIELEAGRPKAYWYFWRAPEVPEGAPPLPERLAVVLPGIGGLCDGRNPLGIAEALQRAGFAVVTVDSTFAWRQMSASGNRRLPGFLPDDAAEIRFLLERILDELAERGDIRSPRITLIGYSMGGFHTLGLAARGDSVGTWKIDRFVAVNPPVSLRSAMTEVDSFAAASRRWNRGEAVEAMLRIGGKELSALETDLPPYDPVSMPPTLRYRIGVNREEATAAIGIYLRASLRELLFTACRERALTGISTPYRWGRRNELYLELDRISFRDYGEKLLAKDYPELSTEELYRCSDLRNFAARLADNDKVRVLHTFDDPLLSAEDRLLLDLTFGRRLLRFPGAGFSGKVRQGTRGGDSATVPDGAPHVMKGGDPPRTAEEEQLLLDLSLGSGRMLWFSNGGHLGNLYVRSVQRAIVSAAMTAVDPAPEAEAATR